MRNSLLSSDTDQNKPCFSSVKQTFNNAKQSFYTTIQPHIKPFNDWRQEHLTPYFTEHEDDIHQELSLNPRKRSCDLFSYEITRMLKYESICVILYWVIACNAETFTCTADHQSLFFISSAFLLLFFAFNLKYSISRMTEYTLPLTNLRRTSKAQLDRWRILFQSLELNQLDHNELEQEKQQTEQLFHKIQHTLPSTKHYKKLAITQKTPNVFFHTFSYISLIMIKEILLGCISKDNICDLYAVYNNTDMHTFGLMLLPLLYSIYCADYDYVSTLNATAKNRIKKQIKKLGHQIILCGHKHDQEQLYTLGSKFINFYIKNNSHTLPAIEHEVDINIHLSI